NYHNPAGEVHDQIDKANADCSSIAGYHVPYAGSQPTATDSTLCVAGHTALSGLDKSGTQHTGAGDFAHDPWTFTDSSGNYNNTAGEVHHQIDQATAPCRSLAGAHATYDGSQHTPIGSGLGVDGHTAP